MKRSLAFLRGCVKDPARVVFFRDDHGEGQACGEGERVVVVGNMAIYGDKIEWVIMKYRELSDKYGPNVSMHMTDPTYVIFMCPLSEADIRINKLNSYI